MAFHNELGKKGEELAVNHLLQKGYKILETNWRYLKAEIDIIAQKENILAIVEVKTRSTDVISAPEDAVNQKKIKLLVSAANEYVIQNDLDVEVRFDIIAILIKGNVYSITHAEEAFLFF